MSVRRTRRLAAVVGAGLIAASLTSCAAVAGSIGALAAILNGVRTSGVTRSESTGRPDLARVVWTTIDRG